MSKNGNLLLNTPLNEQGIDINDRILYPNIFSNFQRSFNKTFLFQTGKIIPIFEERLKNVGAWLNINSEAIYGSIYWDYQGDSINNEKVWYTQVGISFHELMKDRHIFF